MLNSLSIFSSLIYPRVHSLSYCKRLRLPTHPEFVKQPFFFLKTTLLKCLELKGVIDVFQNFIARITLSPRQTDTTQMFGLLHIM